jgi:hypothetical protein
MHSYRCVKVLAKSAALCPLLFSMQVGQISATGALNSLKSFISSYQVTIKESTYNILSNTYSLVIAFACAKT